MRTAPRKRSRSPTSVRELAKRDDEPLNVVDVKLGRVEKRIHQASSQKAVGNCSPVGVLSAGGCPGLDVRRGES